MRVLVASLLALSVGGTLARGATTPKPKPQILVSTRDVSCGFEVITGLDENFNGTLEPDEIIGQVLMCDKDVDFDPKNPEPKTIIRTNVR